MDQPLQPKSDEHRTLLSFIGDWIGTTKTFFEPGVLADESPWEGTITPVHHGMFVTHRYQGSLNGKPLTGMAMLGFNTTTRRFQCSWIDSFHNGSAMMFCEGLPDADGVNVMGHYAVADGSAPWGWRTTMELGSPDQLIIRMYNITPDGEEALAVETQYRRR